MDVEEATRLMHEASHQPRTRSAAVSKALAIGFGCDRLILHLDWWEVPLTEDEKSQLKLLLDKVSRWSLTKAQQELHP